MTRRRPIRYWFIVRGTPRGGAPEGIRAQWDGVVLPVREPRRVEAPSPFVGREVGNREVQHVIDDGVPVRTDDAVRALQLFGRAEAAAWWQAYVAANPRTRQLVFRTHEGHLVPPAYALARFPELTQFDDPSL